ncbi:hypothetical protein FIV42_11775 [Persicimonas caeni]|uniref:Uncharacterized protein n=1 Tax=Persicimonas caeni TaxID=2292766 RepID=A0A4Y6PSS7_PERCE|nr:hypothetical protein [Persicimonas caeni]QDG51394.1 hypothetical protein FIV42_11775 [Persicimonas caeni]QED32615.1 hypothetical protein FRD00_11770 [Persicimonas caeni]
MHRRLDRLLFIAFLALLLAACSNDSDPSTDSETHWQSGNLEACRTDADCVSDLSCQCGVCTEACGAQNSCAQVAVCAEPGVDLNDACGETLSGSGGVCFEPCQTNAECEQRDSRLQCLGGHCMMMNASTLADAGNTADTADAITSDATDISDDADVDDDCHIDCFGGLRCENGEVYQLPYGPMPCSEGSSCGPGDYVGTCDNGCAESSIGEVADAGDGWDVICN